MFAKMLVVKIKVRIDCTKAKNSNLEAPSLSLLSFELTDYQYNCINRRIQQNLHKYRKGRHFQPYGYDLYGTCRFQRVNREK